jgi:uncharacterized membrane protein
MIPTIALFTVFCGLLGLRSLGVAALRDRSWVLFARWALSCMFLLTASAHWGPMRVDLVRMVPPTFPNPELLVTISGIAEIAGALGLLIPRLARFSASGLALLLLAVFPANVHAARAGLSLAGEPVSSLIVRLPEQVFYLSAVLAAGFWPLHRRATRTARKADMPTVATLTKRLDPPLIAAEHPLSSRLARAAATRT